MKILTLRTAFAKELLLSPAQVVTFTEHPSAFTSFLDLHPQCTPSLVGGPDLGSATAPCSPCSPGGLAPADSPCWRFLTSQRVALGSALSSPPPVPARSLPQASSTHTCSPRVRSKINFLEPVQRLMCILSSLLICLLQMLG